MWSKLLVAAAFSSMAVGIMAPPASAKLVRLEINSRTPYGTFEAGNYVRWEGRIVGELSPTAERIPDLEKATPNADGLVAYAARLILIMPEDAAHRNGALLIDVPNRGRPISHALYNSPRDRPLPPGPLEQGTGFLEDQGYSIAAVSWELGQGADLPSFTGPDGKARFVEGVGFAIVRDVADFLANADADASGTANPLAGSVNRTLAIGYSQTGRFLKSLLLHGFNVAEGRRVFAGMHILGAAAGQAPILQSSPGPDSSANATPNFSNPELRGVNEEPLAVADLVAQVRTRHEVPPRIVFVNTTTDYPSGRASLARTGREGADEKPMPPNVRMYDVAGASHALYRGSECRLPFETLDWHPVMRATLLALDRWVAGNAEPPASRLMPLQDGNDETVMPAPKHLPKAVIRVPVRDRDGNPVGGVRLPDVAAPLGTHGLQNPPLTTPNCRLGSAYVPFARTPEQREAGDSRPSLAERYKDRDDYLSRIRAAARELERAGLLLPSDAAVILNSAAENSSFR